MLNEGQRFNNGNIIGMLINAMIKKYGEEKTKYYYNYLFERFFDWV